MHTQLLIQQKTGERIALILWMSIWTTRDQCVSSCKIIYQIYFLKDWGKGWKKKGYFYGLWHSCTRMDLPSILPVVCLSGKSIGTVTQFSFDCQVSITSLSGNTPLQMSAVPLNKKSPHLVLSGNKCSGFYSSLRFL